MKRLLYSILFLLWTAPVYCGYSSFFFRSASDLTTGLLPNARLDPSSATLQGNNFYNSVTGNLSITSGVVTNGITASSFTVGTAITFPDGSVQTIAGGNSQWTVSGSNIRNSNTGNVGIGTLTPDTKAQVFGPAGTVTPLFVVSTGTSRLFEVNGSSIVANVAIYQNVAPPTSFIKVSSVGATTDGLGTVNTAIRQFFRIDYSSGSDISFASSTTLGSSFTINTPGFYGFTYCDEYTAGTFFGVSFNSSQLTTGIQTINQGNLLGKAVNAANNSTCVSGTMNFVIGDIIRPHSSVGSQTGTANGAEFFYLYRLR